jgi:hypothetical protein
MTKPTECNDCPHYKEPDEKGIRATGEMPILAYLIEKYREIKRNIQFVNWCFRWQGFHFFKGNPLKHPLAFHLIYKWALYLGYFEIRMFMTEKERAKAFKIYSNNQKMYEQKCSICGKLFSGNAKIGICPSCYV